MAYYRGIKRYSKEQQNWIATRLLRLRDSLSQQISAERSADSVIIGSWNIRAFDGGRLRRNESYHYIAEIIDHFDICSIQEIKTDLAPLERLVKLLGPNWSYFVSDVTDGNAGNSERMAFLYNENKVQFRHLIGEIVLPQDDLINLVNSPESSIQCQVARTPFFASFQAGWFRFTLCSSHITFGESHVREQEIAAISRILAKRAKSEGEVYIFLGDMNIESPEDATMQALKQNNMTVPLFGATNLAGGKHFDQIAFTSEGIKTHLKRFGVFDWRSAVFKVDEIDTYKAIAEEDRGKPYKKWNPASYRSWTSFEMSDHLPIWVELQVDFSNAYLQDNFVSS